MPIWKISEDKPILIEETHFKKEKLLEEKLEDWLLSDPSIFGETLLILGRQVSIPDIKARLDILALDTMGNAVVIELKRGKLSDPVDMQALRYASYISRWRYQDFENQARSHLSKNNDPEFNFNDLFEHFCSNAGIDETPDINGDQRIIIVGSEVKDKLGSVALWLLEHTIDIRVIEINLFREGSNLFLQPQLIIPLPVSKFSEVGRSPKIDVSRPWIEDGRSWHLEKRCSSLTRDLFLSIDDLIRDNLEVEGPRWNQKFYVAYRIGNNNWMIIITSTSTLRLQFLVRSNSFDQSVIASKLGIEVFDKEDTFAEKLNLPSSVCVQNRNDDTDRVVIRVKDDFNIGSEKFLGFLNEAYAAFPK